MWVYGSPQEAELYRKVAAEYRQQHPEVRLRLEVVPSRSVVQKLLTGMDAGHAPDICVVHWRQMSQVASTGQLLPLDDLVRRDQIDTDDYYPVGLQGYTYHDTSLRPPRQGQHYHLLLQQGPLRPLRRQLSHRRLDARRSPSQGQNPDHRRRPRRPAGHLRLHSV